MTRTAIPLFIASLLVLNACGGSDVPTEGDGAGAENIRTLSGLRDSLNEERVDVVDPNAIEAAAQNIDPFKYGLDYTIYERDLLNGLLADARAESDYRSRSLAATRESLPVVRPGKSFESYEAILSCAVSADVLGRLGVLVPHVALDHAIDFTELSITITADDMESEGFQAFEAQMVDLQENGTALDRFNHRRALEAEENRLRTRHYLNYFLTRDALLESADRDALQEELNSCLETYEDDIAALIIAREQAEAEENG